MLIPALYAVNNCNFTDSALGLSFSSTTSVPEPVIKSSAQSDLALTVKKGGNCAVVFLRIDLTDL